MRVRAAWPENLTWNGFQVMAGATCDTDYRDHSGGGDSIRGSPFSLAPAHEVAHVAGGAAAEDWSRGVAGAVTPPGDPR